MRCPKCGAIIPDDSITCPVCGTALQQKGKKSIFGAIRFHGIGFDDPDEDEEYLDDEDSEEFFDDDEEYFDDGDEVIENSAATQRDLLDAVDGTADEIETDIGEETSGKHGTENVPAPAEKSADPPQKKVKARKNSPEPPIIKSPKNKNKESSVPSFLTSRRFLIPVAAAAAALVIILTVVVQVVMRPERNSPYLGTWKITSLSRENKESTLSDIREADTDGNAYPALESFSLILKETGKCSVSVQGLTEKGTWKHDDTGLTVTDDRGNAVALTDGGDGSLILDMASLSEGGSGVTARPEKQERAAGVRSSSSSVSTRSSVASDSASAASAASTSGE